MKFSKKSTAPTTNGTESAEPATVAGTIAKLRREATERYRAAVRAVAEAERPSKADLVALGEAASEMGLTAKDADDDVAALRSLAVAKQSLADAQAREPQWTAEAKEAADKIENWQHKELPRLRGVVADRQMRLRTIADHMRAINDIEQQCPRLFGPADATPQEMQARRAKAIEIAGYGSGPPPR